MHHRTDRVAIRVRSAVLALGAALALGPAPAALAQQPAAALGEVLVTARKKEESLQQTPITMTAITAKEIELRGFASVTDVGSFTPNVNLSAGATDVGGATNAVFFVRGIGQIDYAATSDPGLGVYVDGVYLGRTLGAVMELADIAQIEILKGPQGTLFGKNSMGGAINVTTREPTGEFGGSVAVTAGEDSRFNFDGQLDAPISDDVGLHLALSWRSQDGFQRRPFGGGPPSGEEGTVVARAKLGWTTGGGTRAVLAADYTRVDAESNTIWITQNDNPVPPPGNLMSLWNALVGYPSGTPFLGDSASSDPRINNGTYPMIQEFDGGGVSLKVEHEFDSFLVRSITSWRTFDSRNARDMDGSAVNFGWVDYEDEDEQFSQEFNLIGSAAGGRLDWTVGAHYMSEDAESRWKVGLADGLFQALEAMPGPFFPLIGGISCPPPPGVPLPCAGGAGNPFNLALETVQMPTPELDSESYAIFGEFEWHFTEALSGIAGARYTHDSKDFSYANHGLVSGAPKPGYQLGRTRASDSWSDVSPRFGLKYQASDDVLLYATIAKGYKAGSYSARPGSAYFAVRSYDPEELWAYELGVKSDLVDRRLRLNAAAFFYDYKDLQQQANQVPPGEVSPAQYTDNIGSATLWGAEADLTALVTDRLTLYASIGYLNSKYDEASEVLTGVGLDTPLVKAPEWSAAAALQYVQPLATGELTWRVDWSYVDESYPTARAEEPLRQRAHSLTNARIAWNSADDTWTVAVYGKNIADTKYVANGFDVSAFVAVYLGIPSEPREIGVQLVRRF